MSRRDRDEQSLIRVTDGAGARLHMQHTHASARTHARAGTRNMAAMGTMSGPVRQLLEGAVFGPHFGRLVTGLCDFSYNLNRFK